MASDELCAGVSQEASKQFQVLFISLRMKVAFKETKQPAQGPTGRKGWAKIQTHIYWSLIAVLSTEEEEVTCHKALRWPPSEKDRKWIMSSFLSHV